MAPLIAPAEFRLPSDEASRARFGHMLVKDGKFPKIGSGNDGCPAAGQDFAAKFFCVT
jgi:hypothetical protein